MPLEKSIFKQLKASDNDINRFSIDNKKFVKKSGISKAQKLFMSQNLAKLVKKLSKSRNLSKIDTKMVRPFFWASNAKVAFNYLWLTCIKASIF